MEGEPKVAESARRLLNAVLSRHAELTLDDTQLGALSRFYWGVNGRVSIDQAVAVLADCLSADQFRKAVAYLAQTESVTDSPAGAQLDELVAAALERQTKDKDLVEVELAAKAAERIIDWARTFGYFVAIPAGLILIITTLFGISSYNDLRTASDRVDAKVMEAQGKLDAAVDKAQKSAHLADEEIAALQSRLAAQDQQLQTLGNKVAQIDQKLSFGGAADLSGDLQSHLEQLAKEYLDYFKKLGYSPKTPTINVTTKSGVSNALSYYDPGTNTIFILPGIAKDPFALLHEYSQQILYSSLSFDALDDKHRSSFSLVPIQHGLADYFPASYLDDPRLGTVIAQYLKSTTSFNKPFFYNLDNRKAITDLVISNYNLVYSLEEAWGGLFWDIRQKLGPSSADKLLYDTWRSLPDGPDSGIARSFLAALLDQSELESGHDGRAAVEEILLRRGLKQADFAVPSNSH